MKIPVFIGSAKESEWYAKKLQEYLKQDFDITLWSEGFFGAGDLTYEKLTTAAISFKYAILVGGSDDLVGRMKTGEESFKPRDNVYFELGLFSGVLTPKRVFFIVSENIQVASDFYGVTLLQYKESVSEKDADDDAKKNAMKIGKLIEVEEKNYRNKLLPAYSLAVGYYKHYLEPICEELFKNPMIRIADKQYILQDYQLKIVVIVPKSTNQDWNKWAALFYMKRAPQKAFIKTLARECDINTSLETWKTEKTVVLYNVPLTMNISFEVVNMILGQPETVMSKEKHKARQLEKDVLVGTLKTLIAQNPIVERFVSIEEGDI